MYVCMYVSVYMYIYIDINVFVYKHRYGYRCSYIAYYTYMHVGSKGRMWVRAKRFRVSWVLQVICRGKRMFTSFQQLGFISGSRFKI